MLPSNDGAPLPSCKSLPDTGFLESLDPQLESPAKVHIPEGLLSRSTSKVWKYHALRSPNISSYDLTSPRSVSQLSPLSPSHSESDWEPPSPLTPSASYLEFGGLLNYCSPTASHSVLPPTSLGESSSLMNSYYQKYPLQRALVINGSNAELSPTCSQADWNTGFSNSETLGGPFLLGGDVEKSSSKLLTPLNNLPNILGHPVTSSPSSKNPFDDPRTSKELLPIIDESPAEHLVLSREFPSAFVADSRHKYGQPIFSLVERARNYLQSHYYIFSEPNIVLPYPPSDQEKLSYLDTRRLVLLAMGIFSFLSASSGVWLFTVSSTIFVWFSLFATFVQIHLTIFYFTGVFGKDFDHQTHLKIRDEYMVDSPETAPAVDIYLPCCKEPLEVLANTYRHVAKLDYPSSRISIHVLDDGASDDVQRLVKSHGFNYIRREDRPYLKKAGNLRWAFARTQGDFFVIYDADFCPRPDFLLELIPRMKEDPRIAIVQTPQYFRATRDQSWVERGAGSLQEIFYRFIQTNRDKWGASVCVGSNAVYRRAALLDCGGVAGLASSEDIHTGIYAATHGWIVKYIPLCLATGVCPDQARTFFSQQIRWCEGSTSLVFDRSFWANRLSKTQKLCYVSGLLYYVASALGIFINPLPALLLLWFRIDYLNYYTLFMGLPSIVYGIIAFRLWSRSTHSLAVQHIDVIQQYAYLSAMVDVIIGTKFNWVPSGEGKTAHKSNRYRNYRMVAIVWTVSYQALFISACAFRMLTGHVWYYFLPL